MAVALDIWRLFYTWIALKHRTPWDNNANIPFTTPNEPKHLGMGNLERKNSELNWEVTVRKFCRESTLVCYNPKKKLIARATLRLPQVRRRCLVYCYHFWFCFFALSYIFVGDSIVSEPVKCDERLVNKPCLQDDHLMSFATFAVVCMVPRQFHFTFQNVWKNGRWKTANYQDICEENRLKNQRAGETHHCPMTRG